MGWFSDDSPQASAYDQVRPVLSRTRFHVSDCHQQLNNTPVEHKSSITHELLAGAASYEVRGRTSARDLLD